MSVNQFNLIFDDTAPYEFNLVWNISDFVMIEEFEKTAETSRNLRKMSKKKIGEKISDQLKNLVNEILELIEIDKEVL